MDDIQSETIKLINNTKHVYHENEVYKKIITSY